MSWAVSWLFTAAAVGLVPSRRARPLRMPQRQRMPARQRMSLRALQLVAALAAATACVALLGIPHGVLTAALVAPGVVYLIARAYARSERVRPDRALALTLDLIAAALRSGQPVLAALALAAPAAGSAACAQLTQVAGLLRLGADPVEAWRALAGHDLLGPLAQAACRSADSGIRLARDMEQLGRDVRAQVRVAAEARAHRAGVLAMAPLGLCFLPAFVCLGVVPVVVGIAKTAFGVLP